MATTLTDSASRDNRTYRSLRKIGWKPDAAVRFIRDDNKLEQAEIEGLISFERVHDDDYQVENAYLPTDPEYSGEGQRFVDMEVEKLNSGEWEVWGIKAKLGVPDAVCRTCRRPAEDARTVTVTTVSVRDGETVRSSYETDETALWGIVVDQSPQSDRYLRSVEIDLAAELGVI